MARIKIVSAPADYIERQGKSYPYDIPKHSGSLPEESTISTKIKPIPEEDANSEIEKGELVLDPETGSIHKALGKPHSKGGTPVYLKPDSFVFSNFKDLAFNKQQKQAFEFKLGGNKMKNNTPSKVLEKEIDLEHHNKMIDIVQNEKKYDGLSANAAKLMVMKNLEKAGQVAFLQEAKKGEQSPAFAQNTAPVYSKETDEQITQSMQYMQSGGKKLTPEEILRAKRNKLADTKGWNFRYKDNDVSYFDKPTTQTSGKKMSNQAWINFLKNESAAHKAKRTINNNDFGYIQDNTTITPSSPYTPPNPVLAPARTVVNITSPQQTVDMGPGNKPGDANGIIDPKTYNTKLTPWQKLNMAIPFYRAATVKTQYPLRQHQESVIPQMDNKNVQPYLNTINQGYFNAANTLRTLNPTQASSYVAQLAGNRIDSSNQAIGNIQNENVQIQNQQKAMAAVSLNQDAAQNRAFDLKYYDQTQIATKNAADLKEAYQQQGIQGINETMTKKLAFDSWLNSQQQYRGKKTYIDKDGVQHYEGQTLYSPQANFFGYSIKHNPTNVDWQNYQGSQTSMEDDDNIFVQNMRRLVPGISDDKLGDLIKERIKKKALAAYSGNNIQQQTPPIFKKGGKYIPKLRPDKNNYYS